MNETPIDRYDKMVNSAVSGGLLFLFALMVWWDGKLPVWLLEVVNPAVVVAVSYGLARWKRTALGWVMFWMQVAIHVAGLFLHLFTGGRYPATSGVAEVAGLASLCIVVWLARVPFVRAAKPQESHVYHHHIVHGADGVAAPWAGTVEGGQPGVPVLPGMVVPSGVEAGERRAIEAPKVRPGRLAEVVREAVRRDRS